MYTVVLVFFFKQKTAYEMRISDRSSDVCSSDLLDGRDDMVRDQSIFGDSARPVRGVEADQPHEAARRGRERARRHPGDGHARLQPVILLQRFELGRA